MRNLVFRFEDSTLFLAALRESDQELVLADGQVVNDGEWVLAIFEVGASQRATAAAARGMHRGSGHRPVIAFERRDWDRLESFAEAGSMKMRAARPVPEAPPTKPSLEVASSRQSPDATQPMPSSSNPDMTIETGPPESSRPTPILPSRSERAPDAPTRPASPSYAHWKASDPLAQGPSARVLLVDDDRDIRDVVGAMLDAVGLTVEGATSAEEALEKVRAAPYDLLVLDWNLPGMTGVELCRLIRRDAALHTMPVLFLTAHASSSDVVEAFASGADDYVVKPFRAPELGARIFGLLRRARMGTQAS